MKQEDFFEILEGLDERFVLEAEKTVKKRSITTKKLIFTAGLAAAVCLCLLLFGGKRITLSERSKGVTVQYATVVPDSDALACLVYLTEEEMFADWCDIIVKGIVTKIDNIKLAFNGEIMYRALAEVQVETVYHGVCEEGVTIKLLLPGAICNGGSNSIMDTLGQLEVGMTGIFMPKAYDEESIYQTNGATLYLRDLAEYGFGDGIRFAFLETEGGLVFDRNAYVGAKDAVTLADIENYIYEMLLLYSIEDEAK